MAKLYVYDSYENRMLVYNNLNENDPMPYSYGRTLSVREFRGSSNARVLWTTTRAMEAWNLTRRRYGAGIPVGYAFSASGRAATARPANTMRALPLMWARAPAAPSANASTPPPRPQGPGVMWSRFP